jgi:hypothetical protein
MCPECFATIAVAITGVISTGTATAAVVKLFRNKKVSARFGSVGARNAAPSGSLRADRISPPAK